MYKPDGFQLAQEGLRRKTDHDGDRHNEGEDRVLVNPVITRRAGAPEVDDEGCLSLGSVRVLVERQVEVTLEAKDEKGHDVQLELEGLPARVVQHEVDHLDGVLIIDRADPASRKEAMAQLRPRLLIDSR